MKSFITNIVTLRKYVRVSHSATNVSMPDFKNVQRKYLVPLLGETLYQTIENEAITNPSEPSELLELCLMAVTSLAYYHDLAIGAVSITDLGLANMAAGDNGTIPRWLYKELEKSFAQKSESALEDLYTFLLKTKPEGWEMPDALNTCITSGLEFNSIYKIDQPHRTFQALRPIIKEVEEMTISPVISEAFLEVLKEMSPDDDIKRKAIQLLKKTAVYLAISESCSMLPVRVSADGFTVSLASNIDLPNQGQQQASDTDLMRMMSSTKAKGDSYLAKLKEWLDSNADYEGFSTYFNSIAPMPSPSTGFDNSNQSFFF